MRIVSLVTVDDFEFVAANGGTGAEFVVFIAIAGNDTDVDALLVIPAVDTIIAFVFSNDADDIR